MPKLHLLLPPLPPLPSPPSARPRAWQMHATDCKRSVTTCLKSWQLTCMTKWTAEKQIQVCSSALHYYLFDVFLYAVWLTTQQLHSSVAFLPVNPTLSPLRNQGRQKLATLNAQEFAQLVIDILLDTKRRQALSVETG